MALQCLPAGLAPQGHCALASRVPRVARRRRSLPPSIQPAPLGGNGAAKAQGARPLQRLSMAGEQHGLSDRCR